MDADLCAGGNSTRRKVELGGVAEGTMDVVPLEMYDSARAKISANLRWLFAKAYGIDHIPEDLRDPFYTDQYDQEHIKPPVIRLLLSCELYCRVCTLILKTEQAASLQSHLSVIQALSRKGIYVVESDDTPVTEEDLASMPIKMSAHMPMIDALMMAYTVEMISIEKVVASVKRFSTFSASKELPFDLEDAMVFWINKVNMKMREVAEREHKVKHHPLESPSHQKVRPLITHLMMCTAHCMLEPGELATAVRYRREHASGRQLPFFPLLENLMRDVCDGAALLTVVHYYCSDLMKLEDICLKEVPSIADSLYNIQLLREFANEYLNKSFYLTTEDMLYSPLVLKHNVMVFIAELFWWFETVKPEFVQPRDFQELKDARSTAHPKSSRPSVPISNATKRSFLASPGVPDNQSSPEVCNRYFLHPEDSEPLKGGPTFSPSHPLLPLRQRQQKQQGEESAGLRNRSNSLTQMDGQHPRASVAAWPEKRQRPMSTLSPFMLHLATDSDADVTSGDSVSLARSISKDSLASNVLNATPKHQTSVHQAPHAAVRNGHSLLSKVNIEDEEETLVVASRTDVSSSQRADGAQAAAVGGPRPPDPKQAADGFYLEPLMPAVLKTAKEKSVCLNKEEESGEGPRSAGRGSLRRGDGPTAVVRRKAPCALNQTFPPSVEDEDLLEDPPQTQADANWPRKAFKEEDEEEESAKLQEDMNVKEHEDKDLNGGSGRSSPCLSTHSQASSMASGSVRMTSFAERKAQQQRFGSNHDLRSSASSSQRTTPDGSECSGPLSSSWRFKRDQSPSSPLRAGDGSGGTNVLASEIIQLRMQLEEKRRAIEHQKKKMEVLSARQRQKLGKAAFLHIVKKGGGKSDTLPNPLKADIPKDELNGEKGPSSKDDMCVDSHKGEKDVEGAPLPGALDADKKGNSGSFYLDEDLDLNECSRSIELLNEAIGSIQQQMMQLSLQQELLMKQNVQSPPGAAPPPPHASDKNSDSKAGASFHYVEHTSGAGTAPARKPPKLTSGRSSRSKPSELKVSREQGRQASRTLTPTQSAAEPLPHQRHPGGGRSPRAEHPDSPRNPTGGGAADRPGPEHARSASFRLHDEANVRLPTRVDLTTAAASESSLDKCLSSSTRESELNASDGSGRDSTSSEEQRSKAHLIEVDLSELRAPDDEEGAEQTTTTEDDDGEQKSVMGFFFKDEQKAEDELAKKRAAFLLKQQKKAEEARLRKQQLEAESELKRDEARRKAEEDRLRKEEEKTRRELIKQEYLRRKQQEMFEEQGLVKPKASKPKQKHRPKAVLKDESPSDNFSKCSSTPDNLSNAQSGSSLSLASAATNEADSVNSGGAVTESSSRLTGFPPSGPKLFKEPSAKSNKPIIHNAISHCCLAGKVNEPQKNQILEELEKCESNHLMILFRDGGCQFRALYSYFPDTEEIHKLTGTGPKSISKKMIDKLYKYSSDRKQFTVIPAKTVSVSVDALTIHNHLWQAKRSAVPKKSGK
uniref:Calmodulin regulated spectrin-associated protein 1b n=1 Tax=Salarias fasciatus TaxID=181472 RepID=A0A672GJU3_SALFA